MKQIINIKVILSFSNKPLLTYLWTYFVIALMIKSTLFWGELAYGDFWASAQLKSSRNCSRELLYIQLTKNNSIKVKYKAEPRMATGLYCYLFSLIYLVLFYASSSLMATSFAWVFVLFKTSINEVSSKRFPVDYVSLWSRSLSNFCNAFLLALTSLRRAFKLS